MSCTQTNGERRSAMECVIFNYDQFQKQYNAHMPCELILFLTSRLLINKVAAAILIQTFPFKVLA